MAGRAYVPVGENKDGKKFVWNSPKEQKLTEKRLFKR